MNLSQLPTVIRRPAKRVGRGRGSGKGGHTTGRGTKGQKSREKIPLIFEGVKFKKSLVKRLPLLRGKGKLKPTRLPPQLLSIGDLEKLPSGFTVTAANLTKKGLVRTTARVKILGGGKLTKALTVKVPTSAAAAKKIVQAGGKIEQ